MTKRIVVKTGESYNNLEVIKEVEPIDWKGYKKRMVMCRCVCGKETTTRLEYLRSGHAKSCGCQRVRSAKTTKTTHGMSKTRLYRTWGGMKKRCYNKNVKSYKYYGAKGVTIHSDWHVFEKFMKWALANGYESDLTIERMDPFGNYEPSNCKWIPKSEQAKNRRDRPVNVIG